MWTIGQSIINGVLNGGVYALIAVGITIVFGVMRLINFASGSFLVLGMYFTWLGYALTGWDVYYLFPFAIISSIIFGYLSFRLSLMPILNKSREAGLLITVGLSYVLQNLMLIIFGQNPLSVPSALGDAAINIGGFIISVPRLLAFLVALICVIGVSLFLSKTRFGISMRATSENTEVSEMLGIKTKKVFTIAWTLGIVLTGIAGLMITPLYFVQSSMGSAFRTTPMIAVILGGLGNIKGAFLAGIILGVVEALVSTLIAADLGPLGVFAAYLIIFWLKPQGLFGKGERIA